MSPTSSPARTRRTRISGRCEANGPAVHALARAGLTARGVIYILIGWIAVLVAVGRSSREADQSGALQLLAGKPYGLVSLWLLGIGFVGYALWRFIEAASGVTEEGSGAVPRLKALGRGLVYAAFAAATFEVIAGARSSEAGRQEDITAKVMRHSGGQWLVGIVGVIVVIAGIAIIAQGVRHTFMRYLQTAQMSRRTRRLVEWLGVIGTSARGLVIALAGGLVIDAAVTYNPSKSGGVDKALLTLRDQPFGPFLLAVVALGLVIFGIYGLCEARWRRV